MNDFKHSRWLIAIFTALAIGATLGRVNAQASAQPKHDDKSKTSAKGEARIGDPFPLDTCPISGKKLGGDPVVKVYDGREIRFCCPACPAQFEKDQASNLAKLDEKIIKDQGPLYPLKTSVVTGKDLPAKPFEFVYGNRLILLGAESEKAEFLKNPKKYLGALDEAVIEQQGKDYPLTKCPVSGEAYGGEMGKPVDVVIAGRLIRLCCKGCMPDLEKDPAKFIAKVDEARAGKTGKPGGGDHDKDEHHNHKHGDN
jgi:YHS domain-containing protein